MRARDYIRSVFNDLMRQQTQGVEGCQGTFLAAALENQAWLVIRGGKSGVAYAIYEYV